MCDRGTYVNYTFNLAAVIQNICNTFWGPHAKISTKFVTLFYGASEIRKYRIGTVWYLHIWCSAFRHTNNINTSTFFSRISLKEKGAPDSKFRICLISARDCRKATKNFPSRFRLWAKFMLQILCRYLSAKFSREASNNFRSRFRVFPKFTLQIPGICQIYIPESGYRYLPNLRSRFWVSVKFPLQIGRESTKFPLQIVGNPLGFSS